MAELNVTPVSHRALGRMLRMTLAPGLSLDLTADEAQTLSRALAALTRDPQLTNDIYLSPLASDADFTAKVTADGLKVVAGGGACFLSWLQAGALAQLLADG